MQKPSHAEYCKSINNDDVMNDVKGKENYCGMCLIVSRWPCLQILGVTG